jgi:hypothetical protein
VPSGLLRQVGCLPDGGDDVDKGRLKKGGCGSHGDQGSWDDDGWGCLLMYMAVFWETVYSI